MTEQHKTRLHRLITLLERLCEVCPRNNGCQEKIKIPQTINEYIQEVSTDIELLLIEVVVIGHIFQEERYLVSEIGENKIKEIHDVWVAENKILLEKKSK